MAVEYGTCKECGASVDSLEANKHDKWHRNLREAWEEMSKLVAKLKRESEAPTRRGQGGY